MPVRRTRADNGRPAADAPAREPRARRLAGKLWRGLLLAASAATAMLLLVAGVAAYYLYTLPLPTDFREPERPALTLTAADGSPFAVRGAFHGNRVALGELPPYLVDAVVTMEDRRFFEHRGVDPQGLLRATFANLAAGGIVQGGSTITQQVARLEFLSAERTFTRKIQEALLALWLERRLSKEEILSRYLNGIYLGAGAHGVDAASRRYFGKPAHEVSLAEAALLAGLIPAPSRYAPTTSPEAAERRAALVLDTMVAAGRLSPVLAEDAKARPAQLQLRPAEISGYGYLADWAAAEARQRLDGVTGDFQVATTIDPRLQELAVRTVERWLMAEGPEAEASQAALVAMRPGGEVLALVGGVDYASSQFNRAIQARRQPGSAFKLFVYLAALQDGRAPESTILDAPIRIKKWSPQNYSNRFYGRTTLRAAFARSLNAATVRLQEEVGRERVIAQARAMGIESPLEPNPSLALGTDEVSLLELTAAYAAVRAGHSRVTPSVLRVIESRGGARLTTAPPQAVTPLAGQAAMLSLLREVVENGTGRAAGLPVPSFGKTGTSQDHRDAWFIGFAEDLVVGVWVGNDDRSPMKGVTGGRLPARIWQSFMAGALSPQPVEDLIAALPEAAPVTPPPEPQSEPQSEPRSAVAAASDTPPFETAAAPLPAPLPPAIPQPPAAPGPTLAAPEASEPAVAEPQFAEPQIAKPETAVPEVIEPEVAEPEIAEAPAALPKPRRKPHRQAAEPLQVANQPAAKPAAATPTPPRRRPRDLIPPPQVVTIPPAEVAPPPRVLPSRPAPQVAEKQEAAPVPAAPAAEPEVAEMPRTEPAPAPPPKLVPRAAPAAEPEVAAMPRTQPAPATAPKLAPPKAPAAEPRVAEMPRTEPAPAPPPKLAPPEAPAIEPQVTEKVVIEPLPAPAPKATPREAPAPEVQVADLPKAEPLPAPAAAPAPKVREPVVGIPAIHDTGTLQIGPHWVRLEGVKGSSGPAVREMAKYLGSREVTCVPTADRRYRCDVDGWDLSEVVLFNGGGRATATASANLVAAESDARRARRGLWSR